ncbi:MAG: T9SS type A sorting domain-containing protein [Bacteroidota bacterium]
MIRLYGCLGLLLCAVLNVLVAQSPTLNLNDVFLPVGGNAQWQQCENPPSVGPGGEEMTWDFSNLNTIDNTVNFQVIDPVETPFLDSFPTANYAYFLPDTSTLEDEFETYQYYFFDAVNDEVTLLGFVNRLTNTTDNAVLNDTIYTIYNDPRLVARLPYTLGSTFTDDFSWISRVSFEAGDSLVTFTSLSEGTAISVVDGYGTLNTPIATYEDVLRLRTSIDISVTNLDFPGLPPTSYESYGYTWFSNNVPFTLMSIDSTEVLSVPGEPLRIQLSTFFLSAVNGMPTNIEEVLAPETIDLKLFPNPTQEQQILRFTLPIAGEVYAQVYSLSGQLLRQTSPQHLTIGQHQLELYLTSLPPANYLLLLHTPTGTVQQHIIKIP